MKNTTNMNVIVMSNDYMLKLHKLHQSFMAIKFQMIGNSCTSFRIVLNNVVSDVCAVHDASPLQWDCRWKSWESDVVI